MEEEKLKKRDPRFVCISCNFKCYMKCDWERHILRPKHVNNVFLETSKEEKTNKTYTCECGRIFSTSSGLWKHEQKCGLDETDNLLNSNLIIQLIKQNQDFKELLIEQNTKIVDTLSVAISDAIVNNNNITNISQVNSNNKTFNLQVFLNEDCKDAMNVSDFMNSLNLQVSDLECVGQLGFVEGISNIIIKRLNAMDITKRPVHCTDSKRETIYIKEDGVWTKDDDDNMKIRKLVRGVSSRNCKNATAYKAMYPEWKDPESKHSYIYDKIVLEAFGGTNNGKDEENENKIIRNILKHLTINKAAFS
jgi:hypothetical protein